VDPVAAPPPHALAAVADGVIVVGASAGGVEALVGFVRGLPDETRQAVCVVLHVSPAGTSTMPSILGRAARLPVHSPADGDPLLSGHIYVAPPDHHLEVERGRVRLTQAPRENGHRPAIDATMRSAALAYDAAVVGFVLSGARDDGTAGLLAIKEHGGAAVVQDPNEALYSAMPRSAIDHVDVDAVLPLAEMAAWLAHRPSEGLPPPGGASMPDPSTPRVGQAPREEANGTRYTCPDCGGVLFEQQEGGMTRFRCSVGHVFSMESLAAEQARHLEGAMWTAVRALEDRAELLQQMARGSERTQRPRSARAFEAQAADLLRRAGIVRDAIEQARTGPGAEGTEAAS
jgi:two-component system, chemotaxis family, protein-glutamate methylesterase/glutaminase